MGYYVEDALDSPDFNSKINILGSYLTEDNKKGVAIVEHKKYPYVAW